MVRENRANSIDETKRIGTRRPIRSPVNGGLHKVTCCTAAASSSNNNNNNGDNDLYWEYNATLPPTGTIWTNSPVANQVLSSGEDSQAEPTRLSPRNRKERGRDFLRYNQCNERGVDEISSPSSSHLVNGDRFKVAKLSPLRLSTELSPPRASNPFTTAELSGASRSPTGGPFRTNHLTVSNTTNRIELADLITTRRRLLASSLSPTFPAKSKQKKPPPPLVTLLLLFSVGLLQLTLPGRAEPQVSSVSNFRLSSTRTDNHAKQQLVNEPTPRVGSRVQRQIPANWRVQDNGSSSSITGDKKVPYKTFYVTRACEWKSNLFVPKSNDIHFAQSWPSSAPPNNLPAEAQANNAQVSSSVVYETFSANSYQQSPSGTFAGYQQQHSSWPDLDFDQSRTMLSTDSKALILALPIVISQTFAGYEPACSIRLIVPRNMRILAKLSSRRLTFAQQQLQETSEPVAGEPAQFGRLTRILWLNVSQNQFIETEHRTIETEGNVLAFRFLLERSANKLVPDTRFQVVLTAFQTLSDNSDLSGAVGQQTVAATGNVAAGQPQQNLADSQFICDQQRLISASLACDGFKNCQDEQDEKPATCLALRSTATRFNGATTGNEAATTTSQHDLYNGNNQQISTSNQMNGDKRETSWWSVGRIWQLARETNSLAGFLLGFLLVLLLLTCCSCCTYLVYLLVRRNWPHSAGDTGFRSAGRREQFADEHETASLATAATATATGESRSKRSAPSGQQIPTRLQSILKKPGPFPGVGLKGRAGGLPEVPARGRPTAPALSVSSRETDSPGRRGALASSLSGGGAGQQSAHRGADDFKPTPARRLTRPTRPVPVPNEQVSQVKKQQQQRPPPFQTQLPRLPLAQQTTTSANSGTQRVTTYHYSSGSTRFSESYLQRLVEQSQPETMRGPTSGGGGGGATVGQQTGSAGGAGAPPHGQDANYGRQTSASPQSSLI